MKILITGGSGFIGRNLSLLMRYNGYFVLSPSREELDLVNIDPSQFQNYLRREKFDVIIHAAGKGGKRNLVDTFENTYLPNIKMFENIYYSVLTLDPTPLVIIFGSGAEFDRRRTIMGAGEEEIFYNWPMDPYGLSKNIISRRSLSNYDHFRVLRLFGCFGFDEDNTRFIKSAINNIKKGSPIDIHQDKIMDFFYIDDVFPVIEYILNNRDCPKNINLVYQNKYDLINIAGIVINAAGVSENVTLHNLSYGVEYCGNGDILQSLPVAKKLIGLEEGIKRMCQALL